MAQDSREEPAKTHFYMPSPPTHVPAELIVDLDFYSVPPELQDPAEIWRDLVRSGDPDIIEAYRDHECFSTHHAVVPPIEPFPIMQRHSVDPPQHNVFRRWLAPLFTPVALRAMQDEMSTRTARLIDAFADRGHCDFAAKLPTGIFLRLVGQPEERLNGSLEISGVFFRITDTDERNANLDERRADPGRDIATHILQACDNEGNLLPYQDKLDCAFLLFVAGLNTVTNPMAYLWRYLGAKRGTDVEWDFGGLERQFNALFRSCCGYATCCNCNYNTQSQCFKFASSLQELGARMVVEQFRRTDIA